MRARVCSTLACTLLLSRCDALVHALVPSHERLGVKGGVGLAAAACVAAASLSRVYTSIGAVTACACIPGDHLQMVHACMEPSECIASTLAS